MVHPKALTPLFLTEMWERYGYYIAQGLLVLFMTSFLHFDDSKAYTITGAFTALVYIMPLLGGFIADRLLGYRYAILLGAILLCAGYLLTATLQTHLLYIGLASVIVGNGFLKPNISSYLGDFYTQDDPRRDSGFTIFYIGINIGVILSTLSSGIIQRLFGWHVVFVAAAIGMLIAIATFILGYNRYADYGLPLRKEQISPRFLIKFANKTSLIFVMIIGIYLCHLLLEHATLADMLLSSVGVITLLALLWEAFRCEGQTRNKMLALIVLTLVAIIFWSLFFQLFFSTNLFIDRNVDRMAWHFQIPTVAFISLEAFFIITAGPFFALLWRKLQQHRCDISTGTKFALAMFATALSLQLLVLGTHYPNPQGLIQPTWIIASYFMVTVGELLLSPIGLSMVTQLAPPHLKGLMMGVWFMSLGFGGALAGVLAQQADVPLSITDLKSTTQIYAHAFQHYAWLAVITGVLVLALVPWLKKLTRS